MSSHIYKYFSSESRSLNYRCERDEVPNIFMTPNAMFLPLSMIHASFKRSEKIYLFVISQVEKSAGMGI